MGGAATPRSQNPCSRGPGTATLAVNFRRPRGFGGGTLGAQLLAVLCDPQPQVLEVPFSQSQNGCAAEGTAWFKLTKLAPADRASLSCGIRQENLDALINAHRITVPDSFDKDNVAGYNCHTESPTTASSGTRRPC